MQSKPWYLSRTILAGIVGFVAALAAIFHVNLDDLKPQLVDVLTQCVETGFAIASLVGLIYGRVQARHAITLTKGAASDANAAAKMSALLFLIIAGVALSACSTVNGVISLSPTAINVLSALQKASAKLAASGKLPAGKTADVVNDTATLSNAFETINTGQGFTDEQALAVAKSFKSDASTTGYIELAATISQFLVPFVNSLVQQGLPPAEVQAQTTQVLTNLSPAVQAGVISVAPTTYELRAIGRDDAGALVYSF